MFCVCSRSPLAHACGKILFLNVDSIADRVTRPSLHITAPTFASAFSTRFTFLSRYAFVLPLPHFRRYIAILFVVCQICLVMLTSRVVPDVSWFFQGATFFAIYQWEKAMQAAAAAADSNDVLRYQVCRTLEIWGRLSMNSLMSKRVHFVLLQVP